MLKNEFQMAVSLNLSNQTGKQFLFLKKKGKQWLWMWSKRFKRRRYAGDKTIFSDSCPGMLILRTSTCVFCSTIALSSAYSEFRNKHRKQKNVNQSTKINIILQVIREMMRWTEHQNWDVIELDYDLWMALTFVHNWYWSAILIYWTHVQYREK